MGKKVMTVKKLRKLLKDVPGDLVVGFETNEIATVSWSVDAVEQRFGFCMLQSIAEDPCSLIVSKPINLFPRRPRVTPVVEPPPPGMRRRSRVQYNPPIA